MADLSKDTLLFLRELKRMCNSKSDCDECEMDTICDGYGISAGIGENQAEKGIEIVQRFHDEHPPKTYAQDFLEKNPKFLRNPENKRHPCVCRAKAYEGVSTCTHELYRSVFECEKCWDEPMLDDE